MAGLRDVFTRARPDRVLQAILELTEAVRRLERGQEQIMSTMADLDAEIVGDLAKSSTSLLALASSIEAKLAAGVDTSSEIAELKAIALAQNQAVAAAAGTPPAVTTPPAPPVKPAPVVSAPAPAQSAPPEPSAPSLSVVH